MLSAVVLGCFVAFAAGDVNNKWRVAAGVFLLNFAFSFIRLPRGVEAITWKSTLAELDSRTVGTVQAQTTIDPRRPLLGVARTGTGGAWIYLIVLPDVGEEGDQVLLIPAARLWRRNPPPHEFDGYAELREFVAAGNLRVAPQSDYSDKAGTFLFGTDWRED